MNPSTGGASRRPAERLEARVEAAVDVLPQGPDEPIGVACSGGADSIALLHLAARIRSVVAMHVDHGLRTSSEDDAVFVEQHASRLGLPFLMRRVEVGRSGSIEAAARGARYAALEAMAAEANVGSVLTAHTLDDQAETVLLRLMRGDILDGIAPVRGIFHRPLLHVRRDELRSWLVERGIDWREDATNADVRFERNWVRNVMLPQLEERRRNVTSVIARVAGRTSADAAALDAIADQVVESAATDDVGLFVSIDRLPLAIGLRVVRRAFRRLGHDPSERDVSAVLDGSHVQAGGVDVWRLDGGLAFTVAPGPVLPTLHLPEDGRAEGVSSADWQLRARVTDEASARGRWRVHAPRGAISIRPRQAGDRVDTRVGSRKVQDILVDTRVPRPLRDLVPIITVDERPLAVLGPGTMSALSSTGRVIDVDPMNPTWSRELAWMG